MKQEQLIKILKYLIKQIQNKRQALAFIDAISKPIPGFNPFYMNAVLYPDKAHCVDRFSVKNTNKIGIVMQGPIVSENQFTYFTVKLYQEIFYHPYIVISTWENENTDQLNQLQNDSLIIIKESPPPNPGPNNINYMIQSMRTGLNWMKQNGVVYTLRTRTDQRIQYENADDFLIELHKMYSVDPYSSKIITTNFFTLRYIPYHISDMFQFGKTEDLIQYWNSASLINNQSLSEALKILTGVSLQNFEKHSEIYLGASYAKSRFAQSFNFTLNGYYNFIRKYFIIIDSHMIGLLWHKYRINYFECYKNSQEKKSQLLFFKDWFLLHNKQIEDTEQYNSLTHQYIHEMESINN